MKIRNGFVSNSSSASYIVTIKIPMDKFVDLIYEHFSFEYFNISTLIKNYKEDIDFYKKEMEKADPKFLKLLYTKDRLFKLENKLKQLENIKELDNDYTTIESEEGKFVINKVYAIKLLLDIIYDIHLEEKLPGFVELTYWTVMHNSMSDIPEVLKSIILYFDFEHPLIPKTCEVKTENDD